MGKGEGEIIDKEVVRGYGGLPYIPATAFTGVLKSHVKPDLADEKTRYFWGGEKDSDFQSHLIVDDLLPCNRERSPKVVIRDGIRIDPATGIVEDKKKFNFEVVEPDNLFSMRCEVVLREPLSFTDFEETISGILGALKGSKISFGAMTTRGFGRVMLEDDWQVNFFDFANGDGPAWLEYMASGNLPSGNLPMKVVLPTYAAGDSNDLVIEAVFNLKSALMVGSYPSDPKMPDKVHIKSGGNDVLPGTSIRGAIRARAERIINTLGGNGQELLKQAFGWVNDERKERAIKSRVIVEEKLLRNVEAEIQSRIRVDRFTGGAADTALFDSMPVWCKAGVSQADIKISIPSYNEKERWIAGLLLQVLKDLWTGDLPIGGEKSIGRGVFQGVTADIRLGKLGHWQLIAEGENGLKFINNQDRNELEACAAALVEACRNVPQGGENA
jgi:CRISPR/Cas system CSM-associated protein Csm3 (group 7 of RAMP superfamily)